MRFALKIPLSSYTICQLTRNSHLNTWDNYIQEMLKSSKQLTGKANYLEFENKKLIEALKAEKKKRNKSKRLNLLSEKDNSL